MKCQVTAKLLQKKQPILIYAPYKFLNFLGAQMHEPKISEKTVFEYFGNSVSVFSGEILVIQRSSIRKR